MRTIIVIAVVSIFGLFTLSFADWGGSRFGGDEFGSKKWGSGGTGVDTYWNTSYTTTGDWDTAYGIDWNLPYNTEIP